MLIPKAMPPSGNAHLGASVDTLTWKFQEMARITGLLSNQGKNSINFYFIRVPLRKKVSKYGTPKPSLGF